MTFNGQVWAPGVFTPPLPGHAQNALAQAFIKPFPSDGYRLIQLVEKYWRTPDGERIVLDEWQRSLLIHILERYPDDWHDVALRGRLRYRQVCVSMGRQNGKSILGGILALYGLLQHSKGPSVIGVATSVEQANVIYQRVSFAVKNDPVLAKKLKATGTRGIRHRDGSGAYTVKPSLTEGLQGVPITLGIADELHISKPSMWLSLVNGQRAQEDGLLVGITTAGDDQSQLLKDLYKQGYEAVGAPEPGRFGFFLWEAPEGSSIDTPGAIEAANPAVACGRIPIETVRSDVRALPVPDQERYTLNRFIASMNSWLPMASWYQCGSGGVPDGLQDVVFSLEKTSSWEHVSITAQAKGSDGKLYTELVATIAKPNLDQLLDICTRLAGKYRATFVVGTFSLGTLGNKLKDRGYTVWKLAPGEIAQACSLTYSKIVQHKMSHEIDGLLRGQMPIAQRKNQGDGWIINKTEDQRGVEAVIATVMGLYVAEVKQPWSLQLF